MTLRNIFSPDASISCVLCNNHVVETMTHLFLHCRVVISVWDKIMRWLDFNFIPPHNLFAHLECWSDAVSTKKLRNFFWLIWHATIWVSWKASNDYIFNNREREVDELVEVAKILSYRWRLNI